MLHYDFQQNKLICTDTEMLSFLYKIYREQRYLAKTSDEKLSERLEHLLINLIELDFNGGKRLNINNGKLASALIDVLEEFNIRDISYKALLNSTLDRFENHTKIKNYSRIAKQLMDCAGKKCLFKFIKTNYLDSLTKGEIRLKLASAYKEDGFNIAIRDDELNITHQLLNARMITENGSEIPVKDGLIKRSAFGDYYIGCFSATIDPKLFIMFDADACLIIKNGDILSREVMNIYRDHYKNGSISFGQVEYIDPYRYMKSKRKIEFVKTVNFEYENEFRFVAFDWIDKKEKVRKIHIDMKKIDYDIIEK